MDSGKMLRKWIKEIQLVGIKDWFWFVVLLKRNEFHQKLDVLNYPLTDEGFIMCARDRDRAHRIDLLLG